MIEGQSDQSTGRLKMVYSLKLHVHVHLLGQGAQEEYKDLKCCPA